MRRVLLANLPCSTVTHIFQKPKLLLQSRRICTGACLLCVCRVLNQYSQIFGWSPLEMSKTSLQLGYFKTVSFSVSCYYFSNEAGSWDEARSDCIHRGADLLVMNNAEEKTFLAALIKKEAWIGLNDKETEGSWKWVDGTSPEFKNWHDSQPDNGGTSGRWGEEDCVHVINNDKATWNDFSCDGATHWICEKVLKLGV
uniref:C-type lectin domain-containing protein n=1 Tax=Xiphophorus couchianus TaxID=32473 RepID=A0A3B5KXS8_9TELE